MKGLLFMIVLIICVCYFGTGFKKWSDIVLTALVTLISVLAVMFGMFFDNTY